VLSWEGGKRKEKQVGLGKEEKKKRASPDYATALSIRGREGIRVK